MARRSKAKGTRRRTKLDMIYPRAAGIDVGSTFHVVAVPPELSAEPVHTFQSFTGDLYRLAHWLVEIGVTTVAMESTGIYWIPVFDILEAHGLEVLLVNAQHAKRCRAVRRMSTMRSGCSSCTRMACCEAVSIRLRTGRLCGCTYGIASA